MLLIFERELKMKQFIILFHPLTTNVEVQMDFKSEKPVTECIELIKLKDYKIYQYIQNDYIYNMSIEELESKNIGFKKLYREKKTWFGLSKRSVMDLLIEPGNGFYYPYSYGNYFYLLTKRKIEQSDFEMWLNEEFPNRFNDLDATYSGYNSKFLNLMDNDDYLIVTSHDYKNHLGVTGNSEIIKQIISKFETLKFDEYEIEKHERRSRDMT